MTFLEVFNLVLKHWDTIVSIVLTLIAGVTTLVTLIKTKKWNKLLSFVKEAMAEADNFKNYTGAEKKAFVLMKVEQFAKANHIKFNINKVANAIEELIALTKAVNAREKDKKVESTKVATIK